MERHPYDRVAPYYDFIYAWKDYAAEAVRLRALIRATKRSPGRDLLDLACGTGGHLAHLKKGFRAEGVDQSPAMLKVARAKLPHVPLRLGDMRRLNLGRRFDVVLCLFSAIGHLRNGAELDRACQASSRHLHPGGVAIVEPWFTPEQFKPGRPWLTTYDGDDLKIARADVSKVRRGRSVFDMHYLIAERRRPVRHFIHRFELTLFTRARTLLSLRRAGLKARYLKDGLMPGRGLYIGQKAL